MVPILNHSLLININNTIISVIIEILIDIGLDIDIFLYLKKFIVKHYVIVNILLLIRISFLD